MSVVFCPPSSKPTLFFRPPIVFCRPCSKLFRTELRALCPCCYCGSNCQNYTVARPAGEIIQPGVLWSQTELMHVLCKTCTFGFQVHCEILLRFRHQHSESRASRILFADLLPQASESTCCVSLSLPSGFRVYPVCEPESTLRLPRLPLVPCTDCTTVLSGT